MRKVRLWGEREGAWCTQAPKIAEMEDVGGTVNPLVVEFCPRTLKVIFIRTAVTARKRPLRLVGC